MFGPSYSKQSLASAELSVKNLDENITGDLLIYKPEGIPNDEDWHPDGVMSLLFNRDSVDIILSLHNLYSRGILDKSDVREISNSHGRTSIFFMRSYLISSTSINLISNSPSFSLIKSMILISFVSLLFTCQLIFC